MVVAAVGHPKALHARALPNSRHHRLPLSLIVSRRVLTPTASSAARSTVRPCRATGVTPAERIGAERERLRPLAIAPTEYALRFSVVVGPTGLVSFQGYRYSMPPEAIGVPGMLWLYPERVRIVAGRFEREHARVPEQGKDSFHPADRAARLAQIAGKRGRLYPNRHDTRA